MRFMAQVKSENKKIGILGGTFDPAHKGHLEISRVAIKKFKLTKIIWAITKQNPFKIQSLNSYVQRIKFAKKVIKKNKFIKIKCFENDVNSHKTIDLIKYLYKNNQNTELYFIMGADNLVNFHKWYKYEKIVKLCKILVFDRNGYKAKALKSISYRKFKKHYIEFVEFNKVNISSSQIRKI